MVVIRLCCLSPAYLSKPSLICDFCPSDQGFAYSFLQIPPHDGHPCCSAIHFPLPGHVQDFHLRERAHGAQTKRMCPGTFSRRGAVASVTIYPCAECASSRSVFIVWKRSFLYDKKVPCTPYDVHGTLQRGSTHFADLQQQSAALLMITESPCPIKDRSEMVFIRDLCQNASSTALQCRYRRFSLIQIPGLLFSSTRCLLSNAALILIDLFRFVKSL